MRLGWKAARKFELNVDLGRVDALLRDARNVRVRLGWKSGLEFDLAVALLKVAALWGRTTRLDWKSGLMFQLKLKAIIDLLVDLSLDLSRTGVLKDAIVWSD